ncbi:uncharacterized protein LOC130641651 isoform X3 [Hydractinia symbiolongicarpus]|uniref:uncharacterized protein LOC130641651 isoform X3 n=1 Tax=Hydractinia symbiolongicarpus TaxID=13093 RepID=UPI00254E9889|nr:uncharacterized protein LOC130641651 isoform X3 [Hydractinia symbiolongicarpus]
MVYARLKESTKSYSATFKVTKCKNINKRNKILKKIGSSLMKKSSLFETAVMHKKTAMATIEDDIKQCQGSACKELPMSQRQHATKVCHHSACQEQNEMNPVMLCSSCDSRDHPGNLSSHLRFDVQVNLQRKGSVRSINSDSGTEEDTDPAYRFDKKNRTYSSARRFFNISAAKNRGKLKKINSFEDSSKELFTLQFYDNEENVLDVEKVPVRKGKSLKDSIETLLTNRGLDFNTHSVFLDSSKTPLPLAFDTFPLGGNTLHVKANQAMKVDERIMILMKNAEEDKRQQGQRQKKNLISLYKDDDATVGGKVLPNATNKLRKSGIFSSAKDVSIKSLTDVLTHYGLNGFDLDIDIGENVPAETTADIILEDSWTDVITETETMSRQQKIQQEAIWELLITERNYLRKVRVIIQVFEKCLVNLQRENFLTEVENQRLFSNINDVFEANLTFWQEYLKQVVEEARSTKKPIKPSQLLDSFAKFEDLFEPYIKYCLEESSCVKYLKYVKNTHDHFEEYLTWCENHQQCNRLKLADLLVKPMQRVTKYGLLLKTVLGKTTDEEERLSLLNMINQVEQFVTKINTTLRLRHEQQKLEGVLRRIESYNPVEVANEEVERVISDYCNFNLRGKIPGLPEKEQRCILLEGPMKMIEKHGRSEVHVFLFTDVLVLAKMKKGSDKLRIIRQPYRLSKILIHPLRDVGSFVLIYLNEYDVLVTAFTLEVKVNEHLNWIQTIEKAKNRYLKARVGNGSTLDFFDDEASSLLSPSTSVQYVQDISPSPDRRSMTVVGEDPRTFSTQEGQPAIVVTDDLRSRSSVAITDHSRHQSIPATNEVAVKRSLSDPKSGPWNRDKKNRSRPISLVSDRDTASWVLNNEERNRSGSIPSDISEGRSSGIGDSFRSINSDGAVQLSRDSGLSMKAFNSYTEVSSVAKLKARFESDCHSPTEESSNSSISTTSPLAVGSEAISTSQCSTTTTTTPVARRTTPPDFMEHHSTIQEEEEQSSNNSCDKITEPVPFTFDIEDDSCESLMTSNDGSSTIQPSSQDSPYENIDHIKQSIINVSMTDKLSNSKIKYFEDFCVQCDLSHDKIEEVVEEIKVNASTQSEDSIHERDVIHTAIQCDSCLLCDVSTQCGDFIHLSGTCDSDTEDGEIHPVKVPFMSETAIRPSSAPPTYIHTPMLDMLTGKKQPRSILKHSFSDLNLTTVHDYPNDDINVIHSRSRSDEPQTTKRHRNSTPAYEFPGMKALQTLSESLESSLRRQTTGEKSTTVKSYDESSNLQNASNTSCISQKSTPPSLRKVALINSSSPVQLRTTNASRFDQASMARTNSDVSHTLVPLRDHSTKKKSENKRNTWHDFDSVALLERIEQTKYGPEGRTGHEANSPMSNSTVKKSMSKSTECLNAPKKQMSFKKTLLKKFSTANVFERQDGGSSSSHDDSVEEKMTKKQLEKERKRMKKEQRQREKEEKKKEKQSKRRSSSISSSGSSSVSSKQYTHDGVVVGKTR